MNESNFKENLPKDTWQLLSERLQPERREKMEYVASKRTRKVRLILQDVHDPHNVAACLRSAEALGVLDIDIITLKAPKNKSSAARGTSHWLNIRTWPSIEECCKHLKAEGYSIAAGFPEAQADRTLYELNVKKPIALLFGNEHQGIDKKWLTHIDQPFTIPTVGMVESLNISVSAAISMSEVTRSSRKYLGDETYYLSSDEQEQVLGNWLYSRTRQADAEIALRRTRAPLPG